MPYRSSPSFRSCRLTIAVSVVWRADLLAVVHLFDDGEAGVGDVPGSLGQIPCEALGVVGFTFATLAGDVGRAHVPAGAPATLFRAGGRDETVEGPRTVELGLGDTCELVLGDFTLRASAEVHEPAPPRQRAIARPLWGLAPLAFAAALHAILLIPPRIPAWRADDSAGGIDVAALRARLGGSNPGRGHDLQEAQRGPLVHVEEVEPAPAEQKPRAPSPAGLDARLEQPARGGEPTTGTETTPKAHPDGIDGHAADAGGKTRPPPAPKRRSADKAKTPGQRLFASESSPKEGHEQRDEDARLCFRSPEGKAMPWVRYRLTFENGETRSGIADRRGATILRGVKAPIRGKARFGRNVADLEYTGDFVILDVNHGETEGEQREAATDALNNLGFFGSSLDVRVRAFQAREGHRSRPPLAVTGELDRRTWELLWEVHNSTCP
jgi:hypothetical protein